MRVFVAFLVGLLLGVVVPTTLLVALSRCVVEEEEVR